MDLCGCAVGLFPDVLRLPEGVGIDPITSNPLLDSETGLNPASLSCHAFYAPIDFHSRLASIAMMQQNT